MPNVLCALEIFIAGFDFREKMKKHLAIETARAAVVTQWTKKVIVEKLHNNSENVSEPLVSFTLSPHNSNSKHVCLLVDAGGEDRKTKNAKQQLRQWNDIGVRITNGFRLGNSEGASHVRKKFRGRCLRESGEGGRNGTDKSGR